MLFTPLKIVLCWSGDDAARSYVRAIRSAFSGGPEAIGDYLAAGEDLGIPVKDFAETPVDTPSEILDSSLHSLVVVLCDVKLAESATHQQWLGLCGQHLANQNTPHRILVLNLSEDAGRKLLSTVPNLGTIQGKSLPSLGEEAIRPAYAALLVLAVARALLRSGISEKVERTRFFISHAKRDALPLAGGFRHLLDQLPWLDRFYDAEDIEPGDDWRRKLEQGVLDSFIIVLRTDIFDERPWCRKEVMWAEERGRPMAVVEGRTRLSHPSSILALSGAPWVRVPDGNLVRVLYVALREWTRCTAAERLVHELKRIGRLSENDTAFIPRAPTLVSIVHSCRILQERGAADPVIIHPEPALDDELLDAATALLHSYCGKGKIETIDGFLASL